MAWSYSDYVTYERGTATRLSRLRLHIQEVSDKIQNQQYTVQGKSHSGPDLGIMLQALRKEEAELASITASSATTNRAPFVRGQALR